MTAVRAGHLHRFAIAIRLGFAYFRGVEIPRVARIVENQALLFTRREAQPAPHDLLIQADRLGGPQNRDQIDVGGIEASSQHRHVDQILQLARFKRIDQRGALGRGRRTGNQRGLLGGQIAHDLFGVGHRRGENHHPLAVGSVLHHLGNDARCRPVARHHPVELLLPKQTTGRGRKRREVVPLDGHIQPLGRGQKTLLDHQAQRLLEHTVGKKALF